jgi:hypothetical protein
MRIGVVGGGIFGSYVAAKMASKNIDVTLFESENILMSKASSINQARLHTGMHYPRDLTTASTTLKVYKRFISQFNESITYFDQYYAVDNENSKITGQEFLDFAKILGIDYTKENPSKFFKSGKVELLIKVPEATFDIEVIRQVILNQLNQYNVRIYYESEVQKIIDNDNSVGLLIKNKRYDFDKIIICTYGMSRSFSEKLGIDLINIENQVCEVLIGNFHGLTGSGLTLMDGNFWSTMPYGSTDMHSLTHVEFTPLVKSNLHLLSCQKRNGSCGQFSLKDCNNCNERPESNSKKIINDVNTYLIESLRFNLVTSKYAVKSIPSPIINPADARPTIITKNKNGNISLIFAGKISTIMEIDYEELIEL